MEPIPVPDRLIREEQGTASAADRAGLAVSGRICDAYLALFADMSSHAHPS